MVQITVDTKHDSTETLRRVIAFLEEELRQRGVSPDPYRPPVEPMKVDTSNPFGSMFGSDDHTSSLSSSSQTTDSVPAPDMFSVFNHEAPSTSTPSYETPTSINNSMMSSGYDTPSASQLLSEDDVDDTTEHLHHTQHLAEEVLQKGSTRKPEMPFNLEPYN